MERNLLGVAASMLLEYRSGRVGAVARVLWHNRSEHVVPLLRHILNLTHPMNTKILSPIIVAAALAATGARAYAEDNAAATPAPAPATTVAANPAQAAAPALAALPAPNQVVYVPRLPTAQELTNAAAAQNIVIEQIQQTAAQVIAVYRYGTGQTNVVSYQVLPTATAPGVATTTAAPAVVYQQPATTTVVYQTTPRVVYYSDPTYYPAYPYYWWPAPVSVSLGFGYRWGGGHWGGGFHGGGFHGGGHRW